MNRLTKLLLAGALVPLSQVAAQAASIGGGELLLAQAGAPACQPGDPSCVPPEKVAPPREKQPPAQPEPAAPKEQAQPPRLAPEPEVRPEAPAPRPEAQPEPAPPKQQAKPERPAPQPEMRPEAPSPVIEPQPEPSAPKQETKPERPKSEVRPEAPSPRPEAQPEPSAPKQEIKPEHAKPEAPVPGPATQPEPSESKQQAKPEKPAKEPQARPEPMVPAPGAVPNAAGSDQKTQPDHLAPKPGAEPERPAAPANAESPKPDLKPVPPPAPQPGDAPKPPVPPVPAPDGGAQKATAPGLGGPGTPPPPAQPVDQPPLPPDLAGKQAPPPPALIEKLGNPGAAAAQAIDQSVGQKAGNIRDIQRDRRVISNEDGVRVTVEPGGRVIVQSGDDAVIRHDDRARFDRDGRDYRERQTRDGGREVVVNTRDGGEVRTLYDPNGMMVQRERRDRDGNVYVLFDNRGYGPGPVDQPDWQQPIVRLPPPVYELPRERYRVEMRSAPPRYVEEALTAPPIVEVQPRYTLDQVIYSPDLRERVRSVDLDTITFPTGAWMIEQSEIPSLDAVARGIGDALRRNPNEVFLVEGYTDAVGSVVDNLSLSDRRAEAVANVLTDHYGIPPENLVTQGYGESYLKVPTEGPERANRRVTVRRITPLLATKGPQ